MLHGRMKGMNRRRRMLRIFGCAALGGAAVLISSWVDSLTFSLLAKSGIKAIVIVAVSWPGVMSFEASKPRRNETWSAWLLGACAVILAVAWLDIAQRPAVLAAFTVVLAVAVNALRNALRAEQS